MQRVPAMRVHRLPPMKMPFGYDEECPLALDFKHRLHDTIEMLILQGYKHMISGGAKAWTSWLQRLCLSCKRSTRM